MKQIKKSPPNCWMDKIMILVYHDLSTCDYTLNDLKMQNQIERRKKNMVYSHINLLYGGL